MRPVLQTKVAAVFTRTFLMAACSCSDPPRNAELLFRADNQVAPGQCCLKAFGDRCAGYKAILAQIFRCQPPKHRPIIDVEDHTSAIRFDSPRGAQARCEHAGRGEMRTVDENSTRRVKKPWIEVLLAQRHVGAILAIKDQRKRLAIADPEHDQGRQTRGVRTDAAHIDSLAHQFFANEAPHVIGADPRRSPALNPSLAAAIAVLVGLPPTYLANDPMSSRRPPICSPYKSTLERPIVIRSRVLSVRCKELTQREVSV